MPKVFRSDLTLGNSTFIERDPSVLVLKDHVYCPSGTPGCVPALYDFGRKLVQQSFYSRGPLPSDIFPACSMSMDYASVNSYAEEDSYIFLGEVHNHYGHFLLSTLSRLWQIASLPKNLKIIINAGASERVKLDHVQKLFRAFGVDTRRFWSPDHPVKIKSVILPSPCFEERNFVHAVFKKAFNAAGDKLVSGLRLSVPSSKPIYLSKSKLTAGVRKVLNEDIVERKLEAEGFSIVYPETLSIEEQAALWRLGQPVVAFNGSALHTSIFSPAAVMVSLGWDRFIDSSFILCDRANRSRSDYFYFEDLALRELGPSPDHNHGLSGLSSRLEFMDPKAAAESILRAVDASINSRDRNIALRRPTMQSSTYVEQDYDASLLSATSGRLTGRYQFCTCYERDPWWQVDLGEDCEIDGIVVFNRTDAAPERASGLRVLVSSDGSSFATVSHRDSGTAFGGLNGEPYRLTFTLPHRARFVRLTIEGPEFFHLDQVEVLGRRNSSRRGLRRRFNRNFV